MAEAIGLASSVIAVAELSAKVLSLCLQYSRDVKNARDDIERLSKEVAAIQATTKELQALLEGPRGKELKASRQLKSAIEDGRSKLENLEQQLQPSTGRKRMGCCGLRALKWPFKSKDVKGAIKELEGCRGNIFLALSIDQTVILQNVNDRTTLNQMPIAYGASFDSKAEEHNPTCLPNTRVELLREIDSWIDDPKSKTIFWLNGMAGTGKSTISRTVARARSERDDLGASFFFKRGEIDRGNLSKFIPTLAYQLALGIPGVAFFIKKTLDATPAIVGKSMKEQFEKLIQEPLFEAAATATTPSSVVMVIDALDECDQEADIRLLINIISQAKIVRPQLRVFLTSRPELPIRLGFREVQGSYQDLVLHDIPAQIVEHDIRIFLDDEFRKIRHEFNLTVCDERKLPSDWPGHLTVQRLADMAVPLFIFAATICRFIGDRKRDSPPIQLRKVLDYKSKGHVSQLDLTYGPVLRSLITDVSGDDKKQIINDFKMIIGSIVMLADSLSAWALSQLLEVDPEVVDNRLDTLHSVLSVPLERTLPVRLLHLSFRDYLTTEESEFRVDERCTHQALAKHCLRIMRGALRKNICGLSFPGMRRSALDLEQLEKSMPPQVQYACMHWAYHQTEGNPAPSDNNGVYDFLTIYFLYWVEAMSLLGRVKECLESLKVLARWLKDQEDSSLLTFVADAVRFIQSDFFIIAEAPLQVYCRLAFTPSKSVIRRTFQHTIPRWISKLPNVQEHWNTCLLTLEGHGKSVSSVAFSHDSKKVGSGSDDKMIRIWDTETGKCDQVLKGYCNLAMAMAFSHDSKEVASGSWDNIIRIWDTKIGKCNRVLENHSDSVSSAFSRDFKKVALGFMEKAIQIWDAETGKCDRVLEAHGSCVHRMMFSHDSKKVASASLDNIIRIWDAKTGKCDQVLKGHSGQVDSVVFSHESNMVASGSWDKTIRIWNAGTGECEQVLKGHRALIMSVTFSHDSKKVASRSFDKTIRIWDAKTGKCDQVLEGHSRPVSVMAFSHDSKMVASGSDDMTIRIWDSETGKCERVLEGHGDKINSVVFSHDSKMVASGSDDMTIRIWDAKTGKCDRVPKDHSSWINSVVFSHDSKMVASGSDDMTIRIWDSETGKCDQVLEGHGHSVKSVVFSHDSKKVASRSDDITIRIWDSKTGKCDRVLKGHRDMIKSQVFSHDSKKIASASFDKTIRIWNARTGECEQVLEGHSWSVESVVFLHDSKKIASGSWDKTIRIWDAKTGKCERVLKGHNGGVNSVVPSHDSKKVASGSWDKTIRIWDAKTGKCEQVLKGHGRGVNSVVFSHDSKKVASSSDYDTIRVWNAETGECEVVIPFDVYGDVVSFTFDKCGIATNRGVFTLTGGPQPHAGLTVLRQSLEAPILACKDSTWITAAGKDLLWLPPECRNGEVVVSRGIIVIGCRSGRVVLLRISIADVEQWMST